MPNFTDITGLAGVAGAIAASMLLMPHVLQLSKVRLICLLGTVSVLVLIPLSPLPIAAYVRGIVGDLSITTMLLLWLVLSKSLQKRQEDNGRSALLILIGFGALFLYPMALGIGTYDPYRLGYGNLQFVTVLLSLALAAWYLNYSLIALGIALPTLAWAVGWYESRNLWDYLLDPYVSIYALAVIFKITMKRLLEFQKRRLC